MQQMKPQVAPRKSLIKKNSIDDDNISSSNSKPISKPPVTPKPVLPVKPKKILVKSVSSNDNSNQQQNIEGQNENFKENGAIEFDGFNNDDSKQKNQSFPLLSSKKISTQIDKQENQQSYQLNKKKNSSFNKKLNATYLNKLRHRKDFEEKNYDSKGCLMIYDVREDEEQLKKMAEISELLVVGGYFRARIKGLHNFDKVIGGMCWAIQMCNIDLDIDIFYQENLSIGSKIALTEKIVRCLQKMKCPFKLEPHQIQGMDCIHIYPVIQWLVKKSLETRQQTADYINAYSNWQFQKIFENNKNSIPNLGIFKNPEISTKLFEPIKENLCRRFLHPSRNELTDELTRVKTTLLEYGITGAGARQKVLSSFDLVSDISHEAIFKQDSKLSDKQSKLTSKTIENKDQTIENLLKTMTETGENSEFVKVSNSIVGQIVSQQSDEIRRLAKDHKTQFAALSFEEIEFLKKETKLKKLIDLKRVELEELSQNGQNLERLSTIKDKLEIINNKLEELKTREQEESEAVKAEKIRLADLLSVLRKQKSEFKQFCREEKQRLEMEIEKLQRTQVDSEQFRNKVKEIDEKLAVYEERHAAVRKDLSSINKRYALIHRKFDEIPNRTELAQYQKRFLELYNQLSNKHNETKKFYIFYNTLSDERTYLEKEFNLIDSILENFQKASQSNIMVKDEFALKFEQTVDSVLQNRNKLQQKLTEEKSKRDKLNLEYMNLVEQQRLYFMAIKSFKEECKVNEQLMAQLESKTS